MDLAALIRRHVEKALAAAHERGQEPGQNNVAVASNVNGEGRRTSVYSDDDVTIIERDGERQVIRHRPDETKEDGDD